ncbi:ORF6C domain-containing protein [Clostridium sp. BJN0013]|jgi:hypothetical protein|uniref:ORF6C domain-containing protein n=1 Tax=Clostridium sp. BJN0013 TaxID=3236840 RepID=UPI0034C634E1
MNNKAIRMFEGQEIKVTTDKGTTLINLACTARVCGLTKIAKSGNQTVRWTDKGVAEKLKIIHSTNVERHIKEEIVFILDEIENADDRNSIYISSWLSKRLAIECHSDKAMKYKNFLVTLDEDFQNGKLFTRDNTELELINKQFNLLIKKTTEHDNELEDHNNRIQKMENNMTIDHAQQEKLNRYGRAKVVEVLGGKGTNAYEKLKGRAFSKFWNGYKRCFGVSSYKDTSVKDMDKAYAFIDSWTPDEEFGLAIRGANAQISIVK